MVRAEAAGVGGRRRCVTCFRSHGIAGDANDISAKLQTGLQIEYFERVGLIRSMSDRQLVLFPLKANSAVDGRAHFAPASASFPCNCQWRAMRYETNAPISSPTTREPSNNPTTRTTSGTLPPSVNVPSPTTITTMPRCMMMIDCASDRDLRATSQIDRRRVQDAASRS